MVAKTAGYCFGVRRAMEMVEKALAEGDRRLFAFGPLIHNPRVVNELEERGLRTVDSLAQVPGGKVVIRSHGVGPRIYREARERNLEIVDATCPFVKNVQQLAVFLAEEGYQVIIIGEPEHAEVKGVLDSVAGKALVLDKIEDLDPERILPKVGVISQTTQDLVNFQRLISALIPLVKEIRIYNTICLATSERQQEAAELSRKVDLMLVVGGKNSANTSRLTEISRMNGTRTYQLESAAEIDAAWFEKVEKVGVTAGASTPDQQIEEIIQKLTYLGGKVGNE
ncbi:MAG: 4-hydroxy-3-methylbut-2-enyl diphosphate reductase [Firmicutes bacterium]|nr:4-hydroxy-3-methylbut-2-enyl diphosphate reductase [Bacillota bacterium]